MVQSKNGATELAVFKGREAKLNRAILQILTKESPQTIWDIKKEIGKIPRLKRTRYHNINTRVKSLESKEFVKENGRRETKAGGVTVLYEATPKAYLALSVSSLSLDDLLVELDEVGALTIVSVIATRNTERLSSRDSYMQKLNP